MALDAVDKPLAGGDLEKAAAALQAPPLVAFEDHAPLLVHAPVLPAAAKTAAAAQKAVTNAANAAKDAGRKLAASAKRAAAGEAGGERCGFGFDRDAQLVELDQQVYQHQLN